MASGLRLLRGQEAEVPEEVPVSVNPFMPDPEPDEVEEKMEADQILGERVEQRGVQNPAQFAQSVSPKTPVMPQITKDSVWLIPAHGGAGATTLSHLMGDRFIDGSFVEPIWMAQGVVVAQTHARGLEAARELVLSAGAGLVPWTPVGLVLIHDTPKISDARRRLARTVAGMYPVTWTLPFVPAWREPGHELSIDDLGVRGKRVASRLRRVGVST